MKQVQRGDARSALPIDIISTFTYYLHPLVQISYKRGRFTTFLEYRTARIKIGAWFVTWILLKGYPVMTSLCICFMILGICK